MKQPHRLLAATFAGFLICAGADARSTLAQDSFSPGRCKILAPDYTPKTGRRAEEPTPARFAGGARLDAAIATPCPEPAGSAGAQTGFSPEA